MQAELDLEDDLEDELKSHKEDATEARTHYRDRTLACKDKWNKIRLLEGSSIFKK